MRKFVGCQVTLLAQNMPKPIKGKVISNQKDRVILQTDDGNRTRFLKAHIVFFYPDKEPEDSSVTDHVVLACANRKIKCEGVKYVLTKSDPDEDDYEAFMSPCPMRRDSCQHGCLGNVRNLPGKKIHQMMDQIMFGEYPKENHEDS